MPVLIENHYLHRKCPCSFAFLIEDEKEGIVGALSFGSPPSHHLRKSASPGDPTRCLELNRLWVKDGLPKNTASHFLSWALKQLPPLIIVSYADTKEGHFGWVYRAANFFYAGWTDMERKTPRYDYVVEGKHSRDAFRCGKYYRRRRAPKIRYWTVTGDRRARRHLIQKSGWPRLSWKETPHPDEPRP